MTGDPGGPADLDARAASTWVSATGVAWAVVPLAIAALVVVDAAAGHVAAVIGALVVLVLGLGMLLRRRRTPVRR